MPSTLRTPTRAGVGLRLPHLEEAVATRPAVGWLEVHPENFLANPHATELLLDLARTYPISVHTVGVSVGSATGVDRRHLQRVRAFVDRVDPVLVSGHLAWSTHGAEYLNDLLPLPYDDETLALVAAHVLEVQDALGRTFLIENPARYLGFTGSTMTEGTFLLALADRTGCQLLCDVSNVHVSGHNMGYDARAYLDGFPADVVGELHLGGFIAEADEATPDGTILIDTHGALVDQATWNLYVHALRRFGQRPTLIEWDNDLPGIHTLVAEAQHADALLGATRSHEVAYGAL
jgi:uncharacterized protein